ncbi:MAG: OsmC family protein [Burkholderiales bacterium]|nr:OsmC family protein [Phycisphaerae bacterium]
MVEIDIEYEGALHTRAVHGPSGAVVTTDAPKDNMGLGEAFSPSDLLATSLGACMLTIMGIVAQREAIELKGSRVKVQKEMTATPPRRVAKLTVIFDLTAEVSDVQKQKLENAAHTCPVHRSLHPEIVVETIFRWPARV